MPQSYALGGMLSSGPVWPSPRLLPEGEGNHTAPVRARGGEPQEPGGASLTDIYQCRALTLLRKNLWFGVTDN